MKRRYSISRIKKVLKDVYNVTLVSEQDNFYKYRVRYKTYSVVDADGNFIMQYVTLDALGDFLSSQGDY